MNVARAIYAVFVAIALLSTRSSYSDAALFGNDRLDPSFCSQRPIRQTVVYVDDQMMAEGRLDWAKKLATKLGATLIPGERVTLVQMQTTAGQSTERWSGCWPAFTGAERKKIASQTYLLQQNPLDTLIDQQKFFYRDLGAALTVIYAATKRSVNSVEADHPAKSILRALAADEGRFAQSQITIRAIVYSDLIENGDLGSVFDGVPPTGLGAKIGTYLRRSVFYVFGTGDGAHEPTKVQDQARAFWMAAIKSMAATNGGIGSDLNVPNVLPIFARLYNVELDYDDQKLDGKLSLLADTDGNLVDSWLGVSRLSSTLLTGTLHCTDSEDTCRVDASTAGGIVTTAASETLTFTGTEKSGLMGQIGVKGSKTMFPIKAIRSKE